MKFKIKIGEFVEQIAQAAITIDPKSLDQPNSKVYLRAANGKSVGVLYYYSTNQLAKTFIKSEVEVLEAGEVLVDAAKLLGGLQGRDSDQVAQVEVQTEKIVVTIGRNRFQLPKAVAAEKMSKEVDALPFKTPSLAKIQGFLLSEFIRRTSFCIPSSSNGQQRVTLDVLHLKSSGSQYQAQASDGNIIALHYGPSVEGIENDLSSLLIPQEALNPLQKLLGKHKDEEIELVNTGAELYFRMKGVIFGCALRTGKYPNVGLIAEQNKPAFEIQAPREELKGCLARAGNFVLNGTRYVQFEFAEETSLKIQAAGDMSDINDEIDCELITGTFSKMQITLALDYIANVVAAMTGENVILGFTPEKQKALVVRGTVVDGEEKVTLGSTYAISPVKPVTASKND